MFTIQVPKPVNEDFNADQLEMRHGECGGGKIKLTNEGDYWVLNCSRCHVEASVAISTSGSSAIAMTSLDGKRRKIENEFESDDGIVAEQSA